MRKIGGGWLRERGKSWIRTGLAAGIAAAEVLFVV